MKKLIAIVCAGLFSGVFADTILYVKPGGIGEGTSWSDAAGLEAAIATAKAGTGPYSIYIAEGVYYPTAMLHIGSGIALYGGFEGVSMAETPETRDIGAHPSIISGDTRQNDRWELFDALHGTSSDTGELIIQGGKIFVPKFANDYDTVAPLQSTVSYSNDNLVRVISIAEGSDATCIVDGVTVQGGGWTAGKYSNITEDGWNCDYGGAIFAGDGASPVIRNCRIVGCYGMRSVVYFYGKEASSAPVYENNTIDYCRTAFSGAFSTYGAQVAVTVKDCDFVGNVRATGMSDAYGCAALSLQNGTRLDNCFFTRNHVQHARANAFSSICVSVGYAITTFVTDCRFEKNSSYSTIGEAVPVVNYAWHSGSMQRCKFLGNKTVCGGTGTLVEGVSCIRTERTRTIVEECVFANNTVSAVSDVDGATVVAATTLAKGKETDLVFANCVFADNAVDAVATGSGAVAKEARSVMSWRTGEATTITMGVLCQCTCVGSDSAPDLVNFGAYASPAKSVVLNSVLWSDAESARVESEVGGDVEVKSSIVRGASLLPETIAVSDTVEYDPVIETELIDGVPYPRISVRNAGNKGVYDVAVFGYYGTPIFAYAPAGTTAWTEFHGYGGGTKVLIDDILGDKRAARDFTKGALQRLTPVAVKYTFDLGNRGTFEDGSSVKTLDLFTGDAVEVPSFTVAEGYTLRLWHDEIPASAGDADKTFKAYYLGPVTEIDDWDDLKTVVGLVTENQPDGAEIRLGAGFYRTTTFSFPQGFSITAPDGATVKCDTNWLVSDDSKTFIAGVAGPSFAGITFLGGGINAKNIPMSFTDCTFSNADVNVLAAISTSTDLGLTNCTFVGKTLPVQSAGTSSSFIGISNCLFRANNANSSGSCIFASHARFDCVDTSFIANTNAIAGNRYGLIGCGDSCVSSIIRCRFEHNLIDGAVNIIQFGNYTANMMSNCYFYANRVIGDRGNASTATACLVAPIRDNHSVYGTMFLSNVVDRTEAATKSGETVMPCALIYSGYVPRLRNNTFDGNVVRATASDPNVTPVASILLVRSNVAAVIFNHTFKDNVAADGDIYRDFTAGDINCFNSIFTGGANHRCAGYRADSTAKSAFYNCVIDAATDEKATYTNCMMAKPVFADRLVEHDGVFARVLDCGSVGRRGGIEIYTESSSRKLVFYNGKYWLRCDTLGTSQVVEPYTPQADLFGVVPEGRIVVGACQEYRRGGLVLILR